MTLIKLVHLCLVFAVSLSLVETVFCEAVTLHRVDGSQESASLETLLENDGQLSEATFDNVKSVSFDNELVSPVEPATMLQLTNGDLMFVEQVTIAEDFVSVKLFDQTLTFPVEHLSEVMWDTTFNSYQQPIWAEIEDDIVALKNGDLVQGTLTSIENLELKIATNLGLLRLPLAGVNAFRLNPKLSEVLESPQTHFQFYFTSGSVLTVKEFTFTRNFQHCELKTAGDLVLTCPVAQIVKIEIWTEQYQQITEDLVLRHAGEDFWGNPNSYEVNRNANRQLLISGTYFTQAGYGVTSQSRLSIRIPDNADSLAFDVGIDQRANQAGRAECSAVVDGIVVWKSSVYKSKAGVPNVSPITVKVPLAATAKSRQLDLVVDFGGHANVADLINWHQPYFILSGE